MEVFVVILLLFGAFSLGSATHQGAEAEPATVQVPTAANVSPDGPNGVRASEDNDEAQLQDCMRNRHDVTYRDLSRVHGRAIVTAPKSAGDCDGECADE